jgi:hypothetical protein
VKPSVARLEQCFDRLGHAALSRGSAKLFRSTALVRDWDLPIHTSRRDSTRRIGTEIATARMYEGCMSLVKLLGFTTLACGCIVGRYREIATSREVRYVEEKGKGCACHGHRRNHTLISELFTAGVAQGYSQAS